MGRWPAGIWDMSYIRGQGRETGDSAQTEEVYKTQDTLFSPGLDM